MPFYKVFRKMSLLRMVSLRLHHMSSLDFEWKGKGIVALGPDDLSEKIREATSHLVLVFNQLAEVVPPEKILYFEDIFPEK